tara:strand:+ start:1167 stop:3686 length:2520 start_codon:yes stop_codon:yes gene_type:complete
MIASGDLVAWTSGSESSEDGPTIACVRTVNAGNGTAEIFLVESDTTKPNVPLAALERISLGDRLHVVASKGETDAIVGLINEAMGRKINPALFLDAIDSVGRTAAFIAAMKGHVDTIKCLEHAHADLNLPTPTGVTPVYVAAEHGRTECVALFASLPDVDCNRASAEGVTPLIVAATNGHADTVHALLADESVDVNHAINTGETAAFLAAESGHVEVLKMLCAAAASVDVANEIGATAALVSAQNGHVEALRVIIEAGADVNACLSVGDGDSPATLAAYSNNQDILHLLIEGGADLTSRNAAGQSAADYLRERHSVDARDVVRGGVDALKTRGNAAFKGRRCREAVGLYTRAIDLANARLLPVPVDASGTSTSAALAASSSAAGTPAASLDVPTPPLELRVRTIVGAEYAVSVARDGSVATLKVSVHEAAGKSADWIPSKQRLLLRGGAALDDESAALVADLGVEDGDVLFLVARLDKADTQNVLAGSPRSAHEQKQLLQMETLLQQHQKLLSGVRAHEGRERDSSRAALEKRLTLKRERHARREARYVLERGVDLHVLFSNRSVALIRCEEHGKALEDANRAIAIKRDWCKGYLRKCSALSAVKRYADAVAALEAGLAAKCPAAECAKVEARLISARGVVARERAKVVLAAAKAATDAAGGAASAARLVVVTAAAVVSVAVKKHAAAERRRRADAAAVSVAAMFGPEAAARAQAEVTAAAAAEAGAGTSSSSAADGAPKPQYKIMPEKEYLDLQKTQRDSNAKLAEAMKHDPHLREHVRKTRRDWAKKQARGVRPVDEMSSLLEAFAKQKGITLDSASVRQDRAEEFGEAAKKSGLDL